MKTYNVDIPVLLRVVTQVEAESEDEAIKIALDNYSSEDPNYEVMECSTDRYVVRGNVFYGCIREAWAEEDT